MQAEAGACTRQPFIEVRLSRQTKAYPAVRYVAGLANSQQLPTMPALGTTHTAAPLPCVTSAAFERMSQNLQESSGA